MASRFRPHDVQPSDEILVECPRCHRDAMIAPLPGQTVRHFGRRLACHSCGFAHDWHPPKHNHYQKWGRRFWNSEEQRTTPVHVTDPWFGATLWLQTPCCGHVLWARNASHLRYLRCYVEAPLREGFVNQSSIGSRLPDWMITAKHRDEVLRGIERLEQRLGRES